MRRKAEASRLRDKLKANQKQWKDDRDQWDLELKAAQDSVITSGTRIKELQKDIAQHMATAAEELGANEQMLIWLRELSPELDKLTGPNTPAIESTVKGDSVEAFLKRIGGAVTAIRTTQQAAGTEAEERTARDPVGQQCCRHTPARVQAAVRGPGETQGYSEGGREIHPGGSRQGC